MQVRSKKRTTRWHPIGTYASSFKETDGTVASDRNICKFVQRDGRHGGIRSKYMQVRLKKRTARWHPIETYDPVLKYRGCLRCYVAGLVDFYYVAGFVCFYYVAGLVCFYGENYRRAHAKYTSAPAVHTSYR